MSTEQENIVEKPKKVEKQKKEKKQVETNIKVQKPKFLEDRNSLFEKLFKTQQEEFANKSQEITVELPDGTKKKGKSFVTTPYDIAAEISVQSLASKAIVSKVNGELWDMGKPLEGDCKLGKLHFFLIFFKKF
jgi:threonyl-tRNA synthetase